MVIGGQSGTSTTAMDLQPAPTIDQIVPETARSIDFDTSGAGKAIIRGRGFGLDARDVVAVVFGPWSTSMLEAEQDLGDPAVR